MRKTITKWFWAWNFDKEEKWLNEMAAKGLALVAIGFCKYTFEDCTPGEYNVRLELLENIPTHAESQQYIKFLEETGAEYLGSITRWVYFRKKTNDGEFNLYSDKASSIKHLNRLLTLIGIISVMNIVIGLSNLTIHVENGKPAGFNYGVINLGLGLFVAYGFLRIYFKKRKLKQEQSLFE